MVTLQAKLEVGAQNDRYEQEADRVADEVMRMPEPAPGARAASGSRATPAVIQRLCSECEKDVQRQPLEEEEELIVNRPHGAEPGIGPSLEERIRGLRGGGQPLSPSLRGFLEPRFDCDFGQVRVHTGHQAAAVARAINAQAFTMGKDVVFGAGRFDQHTQSGRRLLAHELTHVVQQGAHGIAAVQRHTCRTGEGPPAPESPLPGEGGPHPLVYRGTTARRSRRPSVGDAQELLNRFLDQLDGGDFVCNAAADLDAIHRIRATLSQDPLDVDCRFGPNTEKVTKMFQRCVFPNNPDEWDGKIGEKTWPELEGLRPAPSPPPVPPPPQPSPPPPATPPFTPEEGDTVCDRGCQGEFHDCMDPANEETTREDCERAFEECEATCEDSTGTPTREAPASFCVPFPNTPSGRIEAVAAAIFVEAGLTPLFAAVTAEADALKDAYLAGPKRFPAPRTTFDAASGSPLAESFRDHNISERDRDDVADLVERKLPLPPLVHVRPTTFGRELSSNPVDYSTFLSTAERTRSIVWNDLIPSDPELLAGGVGRGKGGPDSRTISGEVTRVRDEGLIFDTEELVMKTDYHIRETFDFCPGNPGAIAQVFTIPLSRLEVTSFMPHDDQPFDVKYSYDHTKSI